MDHYIKCAFGRKRHRFAQMQLDLFEWQPSPVASIHPSESLAIRAVARRFGLPVHLARVVAENANLGGRA